MLRLLRVVTSKGNAQFKTIKMVKKIIYYLNINFYFILFVYTEMFKTIQPLFLKRKKRKKKKKKKKEKKKEKKKNKKFKKKKK